MYQCMTLQSCQLKSKRKPEELLVLYKHILEGKKNPHLKITNVIEQHQNANIDQIIFSLIAEISYKDKSKFFSMQLGFLLIAF